MILCVCTCVCTVWLSAIVAITIISLIGLTAVVLIPVMSSRNFYNHLLHFLVAVAIATLTGDAFLHLLPHVRLRPIVLLRRVRKITLHVTVSIHTCIFGAHINCIGENFKKIVQRTLLGCSLSSVCERT